MRSECHLRSESQFFLKWDYFNTYKYRLLGNFIFICKLLIYNKSHIIKRFCQNLARKKDIYICIISLSLIFIWLSLISETSACLRLDVIIKNIRNNLENGWMCSILFYNNSSFKTHFIIMLLKYNVYDT